LFRYGEFEFEFEPFYIGKGIGNRWKNLDGRSDYFKRTINKIKENGLESIVLKLKENINEYDSFVLESELINIIGRKELGKGPLLNFTDGGEGSSGRVVSEETLEKKRKDFSDIKKEFEERNYILLTEEKDYKNCYTKLKCICKNNHSHSTGWANFQQGYGCPICGIELLSEKLRMNFSDIKKEFEERNYKLLTDEKDYKNVHQKLDYIHNKCGNRHSISWTHFKQGHNCSYCAGTKIYFSDIKKEFEERDYKLLTEEKDYKNAHQKLDYIHLKCGNKHSISWNNFQQGKRCPKCNKENREKNKIKITQYEIDNMFAENM